MQFAKLAALVLFTTSFAATQTGAGDEGILEARKGFTTKLTRTVRDEVPLEAPPEHIFSLVQYPTELGPMSAYLGQPLEPGRKHPAILWITGGFPPGGIDADAWEYVSPENDQSAKAYRKAGLVMMYPAFRGGSGNPGSQETFFGEVQDVLAALRFLREVEHVDPDRIYLGGHSTGGTLALLVSAATDGFRAVFSFGPVEDPCVYGKEWLTYDPADETENRLRSPIHFLAGVRSPTFVIEGEDGNVEALHALRDANENAAVRIIEVEGASHFDLLAPVNELLAKKAAALAGKAAFDVSAAEIQRAHEARKAAIREADDLDTLAAIRRDGIDWTRPRVVQHFLLSRDEAVLTEVGKQAKTKGFEPGEVSRETDDEGRPYFVLILEKRLSLRDLDAVFAASKAIEELRSERYFQYDGWDVEE